MGPTDLTSAGEREEERAEEALARLFSRLEAPDASDMTTPPTFEVMNLCSSNEEGSTQVSECVGLKHYILG